MADDWGSLIGGVLGGAAGAILGPVGVSVGGALGSSVGSAVGDWFSSDEDGPAVAQAAPGLPGYAPGGQLPPWMQTGSGLGNASGGGGAGSSWTTPATPNLPAVPQYPTGGLQGPVYGTQAWPAAANTALQTVLAALRAYPYISDTLQRYWDFPTETEVTAPKSQALWTALAAQLPKTHREALEQFLVGFPTTIGLPKAAEEIFLTLKIAEAGYTPAQICCVKEVK